MECPSLLVGGILGEFLQLSGITRYLVDVKESLLEMGAPEVKVIQPQSFADITANADKIKNEIMQLVSHHGRGVLAFGHSKGALELLWAVVENPELLEKNYIEKLVFVQAPFGGSELTHFLGGKKSPFNFVKQLSEGGLFEKIVDRIEGRGENFKRLLEERSATLVGSTQRSRNVNPVFRPAHTLIKVVSRENRASDGVINEKSQVPPFESRVFRVESFDHGSLVTGFPFSNVSRYIRKNYLKSVFEELLLNPVGPT